MQWLMNFIGLICHSVRYIYGWVQDEQKRKISKTLAMVLIRHA